MVSPQINPKIFRMYDIRGIVDKDITPQAVELLGKGVGTLFLSQNINQIIVGRDNRPSGEEIQTQLCQALASTGINVVNVGLTMTPMIYFSWHQLDANAALNITGSHNPAEYNGFKITRNKQAMYGDQYQELLKLIQSGKFKSGKGKITAYDLWPEYKQTIIKDIKLVKPLKVVIDTGNGTCGPYAPELLRELGCEVIELYTESDGNFPNHPPYPQKTEFYQDLIGKVKSEKADLGLAFDGDGDRLGVYESTGDFIQSDVLAMLFTRNVLKTHPNSTIVMNISTSAKVLEDMKNHGGQPIIWKTGYPLIIEKMIKTKAIFGGEISGHFFFKDRYFGFDDAIYAAARILEIKSQQPQVSLTELIADAPEYVSTPEFRVKADDKWGTIKSLVSEIKSEFPDAEVMDIDGIRFSFPDKSWALIRPSNTESLLTGRAEAKTEARLEELKTLIKDKLLKYKVKLDWSHPID